MSEVAMCYKIGHAVGPHSKNDPADVRIVQRLLNETGGFALPVTGTCDKATAEAVVKFQSGFDPKPDGRVNPGGITIERLQSLGPIEMPAGGGRGWYRYETGDEHKSRYMHFGTANTVQAVLDVARTVALNMPGYAIGVGDLSSAAGGNLGRHKSHLHGINGDVRPFRKDGGHLGVTYHEPTYSREKTPLLAKSFLAHQSVNKIYFNDPDIIDALGPRVQHMEGHDNHLHVIMRS